MGTKYPLRVPCHPMVNPASPTIEDLSARDLVSRTRSFFEDQEGHLFDANSQQWVKVDNFSFDDDTPNHFEAVKTPDSSFSILDSQVLEADAFKVEPEDEAFEANFKRRLLAANPPKKVPPTFEARRSSIPKFVRNKKPASSVQRSNSNVLKLVRKQNQKAASHSRSITNLSVDLDQILDGQDRSRSEGALDQVGLSKPTKDFQHVQSKVKQYIADIKQLPSKKSHPSPLSFGQKSLSLSNLSQSSTDVAGSGTTLNNLQKMKSFISTSNLNDVKVTLTKDGHQSNPSCPGLDRSKLYKLLDNLSDEDERDAQDPELTVEIGEILSLALIERREKRETEFVLAQLQSNCDQLQRKYAAAEIKIDKLRFGSDLMNDTLQTLNHDSAFTDLNTSQILAGNHHHPLTSHSRNTSIVFGCEEEEPQRPRTSSVVSHRTRPKFKSRSAREFHEEAIQCLQDMEEKLLGLELGHGMPNMESVAIKSDLKETFSQLVQASEKSESLANPDPSQSIEFHRLLLQVGRKLEHMEDDPMPVDPIQKVRNWSEQLQNLTSFSQSFQTTSPSPPLEDKSKDLLPHSPPAEFDSGYPGSDRSLRHYSLRGMSPQILTQLAEEQLDGPLGGGGAPMAQKDHNLLRVHVHSITDLSSDEKSMFEAEDVSKISSQLSTHRQPVILAQEIDAEINELRNFFEDHREEMMTMLKEPPDFGLDDKIQHLQESFRTRTRPIQSLDVGDWESWSEREDFMRERRREFHRRRGRRSRSKKKSASMTNLAQITSEADSISRMAPDFHIGSSELHLKSGAEMGSYPPSLEDTQADPGPTAPTEFGDIDPMDPKQWPESKLEPKEKLACHLTNQGQTKAQIPSRKDKTPKKPNKAKQELKAMLASLEQANLMAGALRRKSEEILGILNSDVIGQHKKTLEIMSKD